MGKDLISLGRWNNIEPIGLTLVNQVLFYYADSIKWKYNYKSNTLTIAFKDKNLDACLQDIKSANILCEITVNKFSNTITIEFKL